MPRAFDEDPREERKQKVTLKNVSSQKSIIDAIPKKASPQQFQQQVHESQEKISSYKRRASELALQFNKTVMDKTLIENKNIFAQEMERELLQGMIQLAIEINNDSQEQEGMGSLSWITLLFKTCLSQRDRINQTEYKVFQLEKKLDSGMLTDYISKEISKAIDKKNGQP
jgi:hypothetical protein